MLELIGWKKDQHQDHKKNALISVITGASLSLRLFRNWTQQTHNYYENGIKIK